MNDYQPTRADKFSLRALDRRLAGADVFGGADPRPARPGRGRPPPRRPRRGRRHVPRRRPVPVRQRRRDPRPRSSPGSRTRSTRPAWASTMVTTNLFSHPVFKDGGFTSNDRDVRRFAIAQGAAQHRPGRRARREDLRAVGRPRGRRVRRRQGRPGRARPVPRRPSTCSARTCATRATTSGSRSSPSRTSRAATSCCRPIGHALALHQRRSTTPDLVGLNPEVGHEEMAGLNYAHGIAQALWHGKLFHIDLNGQHGPRFDQDLRFGAGNVRGAFWTVDTARDRRVRRPRALRLQAAAHRGRRGRLGDRARPACATT